jgi:fatty-acyl-CoA synthase
VVVTDARTLPAVLSVRSQFPELGLRVVAVSDAAALPSGVARYRDLVAAGSPSWSPARRHTGSADNVVYTSGTTGKPKGAVRDFAAFGLSELFRLLERLPFRTGDRHLAVSPLYHSAGQALLTLQASLAATVRLLPHFEPEDTLRALSSHRAESTFLVPTMIRRLVTLPDRLFAQHPTPQLRCLLSGASEFPQRLREQAIARFGASAVFDFYGATELGWVTLINGAEMLSRPASVGRPLAGQQIRILGPEGQELPPGEVGLISVRNAQTMAGYLHDAAATKASRSGAWTTVEDLGSLDSGGYLFLAGRARDMVKSGGVNLYPVEIEEVLARHPSIREVAVIGVPDREWGERLVGVVVQSGSSFEPADVERFARGQLSGLKVPRQWEVVDELPRNATGKVLKMELCRRFAPVGSQA